MPSLRATETTTVNAPPADPIEDMLMRLAFGAYQNVLRGAPALGEMPGNFIPPDAAALVRDAQEGTMRTASNSMRSLFEGLQGDIYDQAARRGALGGSFVPTQVGIAARGLQDNFAQVASNAQSQAASQTLGIAQGYRQEALQRAQLALGAQQWGAQPGLLGMLQQMRVNLSGRTTVTEQQQPTDYAALFGGLGDSVGSFMAMRRLPKV